MNGLIIDNFAGGGGASTGIANAIGRSVDIAINHDKDAIAMHKTNHPETKHYCESVFDVDPVEATNGKPVTLAWFSPDCRHYSKARGSAPVKKEIRGLAWIAIRWALLKRPRVMMLENVEEFKTWGPTIIKDDGQEYPDTERSGETFEAFIQMLTTGLIDKNHPALKEVSEVLNFSPDSFYIKKLQKGLGYNIEFRELYSSVYGAPTRRKRFFIVMRCDGQDIVWPEPTHYDEKAGVNKKNGLKKCIPVSTCIDWSIPCPSIFERKKTLAENTLKRIARGMYRFVINNPQPFIVRIGQQGFGGDKLCYDINSPLTTVTSKAEHLLVCPTIIQYHTERSKGEVRGQDLDSPIKTIDTNPRYAMVTSFLAKHYGGNNQGAGIDISDPLHTITTTDHHSLVSSYLIELRGSCKDGKHLDNPLPTITASGAHFGEVRAFLVKYYGNDKDGCTLDEPLHTITSKERFGLVTVHGRLYQIVDIGMRMLQPHELFKAQGFPDSYIIDRDYKGNKFSKKSQNARCGNAVPPQFSEALVRANLPEICKTKIKVA